MNCEQISDLLPDYLQGSLERSAEGRVEQHLRQCDECRESVALWNRLGTLPPEQPSLAVRERFNTMLSAYRAVRADEMPRVVQPRAKVVPFWSGASWQRWAAVAACAVMLLGGGFVAGRMTSRGVGTSSTHQDVVAAMRDELTTMRQLVVLSMMQQQSATQRLEGIAFSTQQPQADPKVLEALLQAVRYDPNVDVRLAALDALGRYGQQPTVQQGLIQALQPQQSPLVQVAAIDQLVEMRLAKAAQEDLQRVKQDPSMNPAVRRRAEWALSKLN